MRMKCIQIIVWVWTTNSTRLLFTCLSNSISMRVCTRDGKISGRESREKYRGREWSVGDDIQPSQETMPTAMPCPLPGVDVNNDRGLDNDNQEPENWVGYGECRH